MNARLALFLSLGLSALVAPLSSRAQIGEPAVVAPAPLRSDDELDQLLGPIALYPDALLAIVLPASTKPVDIVMAIRYLQSGRTLSALGQQPWDESVIALAHQREALEYLDANLLWTRDLAEAFTAQPEDVMRSVQRLRRAALNAGTLKDSPQHKLVVTEDTIRIVPADPEIIYVPRYDSRVVYVERPIYHHQPLVTFGVGFAVGSWLNYDCDWGHRRIYISDRSWLWHSQPAWRHSRFHYGPRYESYHWRPWSPSYRYSRPHYSAPIHPRSHSRPSYHPAPRYDDSRRHDRREHDRWDHDRRDHDRRDPPRYDDPRRRSDNDRRDHTPRLQPQPVTPTPVANTPPPAVVQPAPVNPRRYREPGENRRPEYTRPNLPRVSPENRSAEHFVPRPAPDVRRLDHSAPRVATVQPAPRAYTPPPAHRPAPPARAETREERPADRADRSEPRVPSAHRPRQFHEN